MAGCLARCPRALCFLPLALAAAVVAPAHAAPPSCNANALTTDAARERTEDRSVTVRGVVTGVFPEPTGIAGFYLQSRGARQGVFVYAPDEAGETLPEVHRRIVLNARTGRYRGRFQLERATAWRDCGRASLAPAGLTLPADSTALAGLEDTLVRIPAGLVVTDNSDLLRYGSLGLAVGDRLRARGGPVPGGRPAGVVLDDGRYTVEPADPAYLDQRGTRRLGARLGPTTGVLDHAFGAWRLHPTGAVRFRAGNPRRAAPTGSGALRVASFNLHNLFYGDHARARSSESSRRRQRADLVAAIRALEADIIVLQELQNRDSTERRFLAEINADVPTRKIYRRLAVKRPGRAVLRNAVFYRPAVVTLLEGRVLADRAHDRPPLAGLFETANGVRLALIGVHFKSKGGCDARERAALPPGGCGRERRMAQAESVLAWSASLANDWKATHRLLLGDFNSYAAEPPVQRLLAGGWKNLAARRVAAQHRYSYVYRGRAGQLDYVFARGLAGESVRRVGFWHINADEPRGLNADGPWRSADHDPVFVDIDFPAMQ